MLAVRKILYECLSPPYIVRLNSPSVSFLRHQEGNETLGTTGKHRELLWELKEAHHPAKTRAARSMSRGTTGAAERGTRKKLELGKTQKPGLQDYI